MPRACRSAALLLVLLAPALAQAARGRLGLFLSAGAGYASDAVGPTLGSDAFGQVAPSARLDLALSPAWKLATAGDVTLLQYAGGGDPAVTESADAELRWIASDRVELQLAAGAEHASHGDGSALDPLLVAGPIVTATLAGTASALLRLRAVGVEWRLGAAGAARASAGLTGDVSDEEVRLVAGLRRPLGRRVAIAATYGLSRTASADPTFAVTSHALLALASWAPGDLSLRAQLQLQRSSFDSATREELARATLSASYPLAETLALEAVYGFAVHDTTDPTRPSATRHLAFAGLRWRPAEVTW